MRMVKRGTPRASGWLRSQTSWCQVARSGQSTRRTSGTVSENMSSAASEARASVNVSASAVPGERLRDRDRALLGGARPAAHALEVLEVLDANRVARVEAIEHAIHHAG